MFFSAEHFLYDLEISNAEFFECVTTLENVFSLSFL
jgi:hypothetical protein